MKTAKMLNSFLKKANKVLSTYNIDWVELRCQGEFATWLFMDDSQIVIKCTMRAQEVNDFSCVIKDTATLQKALSKLCRKKGVTDVQVDDSQISLQSTGIKGDLSEQFTVICESGHLLPGEALKKEQALDMGGFLKFITLVKAKKTKAWISAERQVEVKSELFKKLFINGDGQTLQFVSFNPTFTCSYSCASDIKVNMVIDEAKLIWASKLMVTEEQLSVSVNKDDISFCFGDYSIFISGDTIAKVPVLEASNGEGKFSIKDADAWGADILSCFKEKPNVFVNVDDPTDIVDIKSATAGRYISVQLLNSALLCFGGDADICSRKLSFVKKDDMHELSCRINFLKGS